MIRLAAAHALILLLATRAWAQQPSHLSEEQKTQARQAFENGSRKFDLGRFEEAAGEFGRAYELSGNSELLYNIAIAFRKAEKNERALFFYQRYLSKVANAPNRAEVERRIAELSELVAKQRHVSDSPPTTVLREPGTAESHPTEPHATEPPPSTPPSAGVTPNEPRKPPSPALKYAGYALAGVAVVGLSVGIAMSVLAGAASKDVEQAGARHDPYNNTIRDKESAGSLYNTLSIVGYTVAGAAAVGAAVTLVLGLRKPSSRRAGLAPWLAPGQGGLVVGGTF